MEIKEVIKILESHNKWRRGSDDVEPTNPKLLGMAIDRAVEELRSCNVVTHEDIIKILQLHSYNVEDQAGNKLIVVDEDSFDSLATELKNCCISDDSKRTYNEYELRHIAVNYAIHCLKGYEGSFTDWFNGISKDWRKIANEKRQYFRQRFPL